MGRYLTSGPETPVYTHGVGELCDCNSSDALLGIGGVFTGAGVSVLHEAVIVVSVYSDVASATDGLSVEFSTDNINWEHTDVFTIPATTGKTFTFQPVAQYFRVVYTNGAIAQTVFRLQVVHKNSYVKPSSHRIADSISGQDDAELVKSILTAADPDGNFVNIEATASHNLRTTNAESGLAIAKGDVIDTGFMHKFGAAPDFDTGDGFVTVWDGAEDGEAYEQMVYNYSTTDDIDYVVAEDNTDTQDLEIEGLDANYELVTQTATLVGNTPVELATYLLRVFRMKNVGATDFGGHVFCYVSGGAVVAGVPQVGADVRAVVHSVNNQTLMAIYTIPAGMTGYMRSFYATTAGAKKVSGHTVKLLARPVGGVFQLKHITNIETTGTSHMNHMFFEPEVFMEKTDLEVQMDTSADEAGVAAGFDIVLVDN